MLVTRTLDLDSSIPTLAPGSASARTMLEGRRLITPHGPRYRLVIVGAGQMSRYVAQFALARDYQVIVCDPRSEYLDEWDDVELSREMPDDLLLREALKSPAFYIGAIGSRSNNAKRRERLAMFDISAGEIGKLPTPAWNKRCRVANVPYGPDALRLPHQV